MAYGLRVFADEPVTATACVAQGGTFNAVTGCTGFTQQIQYDSTLDGGFMFIGRVNFGDTGNGAGTYSIAAEGITELFALYVAFSTTNTGQIPAGNNPDQNFGRPLITVGAKSGNNFPVTVVASGADNRRAMIGGSIEFFGR